MLLYLDDVVSASTTKATHAIRQVLTAFNQFDLKDFPLQYNLLGLVSVMNVMPAAGIGLLSYPYDSVEFVR